MLYVFPNGNVSGGMNDEKDIPDISEVDFDTRLKVLLGVPPAKEEEEQPVTSPSTESDPDK